VEPKDNNNIKMETGKKASVSKISPPHCPNNKIILIKSCLKRGLESLTSYLKTMPMKLEEQLLSRIQVSMLV